MFDSAGAFSRAFVPADGGYAYFPSAKSGGKFVTTAEYEALVADWRLRWSGWGFVKSVGVTVALLIILAGISVFFALPAWTAPVAITIVSAGLIGWVGWAAFAPWRLVRGRPDVLPPRSLAEVRRAGRASLGWPMIILGLLFSGTKFFGIVMGTVSDWRAVAGGILFGAMFAGYIAIASLKLRDRWR